MHASWESFLIRYRPMAHAIAQSLVARSADAEDVVQEATLAFLGAVRGNDERFADRAHARHWFLRTVRNLARRSHRGERPGPLRHEPAAADATPRLAIEEEVRARRARLARALRTLEPAERDLVARRFARRQTLAAIAAETGVPVSTLHSREKALLAKLARRVERDPGSREEPT